MYKRTYIKLLLAIGAFVFVCACGFALYLFKQANDEPPEDPGNSPISEAECMGLRKSEIIEKLGVPSREWKGLYGGIKGRELESRPEYQDAISVAYERSNGTLYLTFVPYEGELRCIAATWLPKGFILD